MSFVVTSRNCSGNAVRAQNNVYPSQFHFYRSVIAYPVVKCVKSRLTFIRLLCPVCLLNMGAHLFANELISPAPPPPSVTHPRQTVGCRDLGDRFSRCSPAAFDRFMLVALDNNIIRRGRVQCVQSVPVECEYRDILLAFDTCPANARHFE